MSWDTDAVQTVRYIIGDVDTPQKYTDARLKTACVISANLINNDITLNNTYTVSVSGETITPDPTSDPADLKFIDMITTRASILILQGELKIYANNSVKIVDGPSSIDIANVFANTQKLLSDLSQSYAMMKNLYHMNGTNYGKSVMTPTINTSVCEDYYYDRRS
jgi:hypothetical protein